MRIGVDACCWSNRRGYGRFTRELVTRMVADFAQHRFVLVVDQHTARDGTFPESAELVCVPTREQPTQAASADGSRSVRDLWRMSRAASRLHADVFFFPTRYSFYPLLCKTPTVVAFHDATAENHPDLIFPGMRSRLFWRLKTWLALRQADRLVTVSGHSRSQISAAFGYPESGISVITEGPDARFQRLGDHRLVADVLRKYNLPQGEQRILYVGGISPHKNLQALLRALSTINQQSAWRLVLVGDYKNDSFYGCHQELVELSQNIGLEPRITFTGYVPDDDLVALYNAATVFVLPSMNEGFGLPVVEAMACGVPVAASKRGSLPEVLGDAGVYFDPQDPGDIAAALLRLMNDCILRESLRAEGFRRAAQFSWKTGAEQLVKLFEDLHSS